MNINPGELDKKVQIIKKKEEINENGFPVLTDKVVRSCFARYTVTSGNEIIKAGTEFSKAKARFLVRYSQIPVDTDMIIRYAGGDYNIEYVNPYGDSREYIEIWASLMKME